jgi:hypothetical protein
VASGTFTGWSSLFDERFPAIEARVRSGGSVILRLCVDGEGEDISFARDCLHVVRNGKSIVGIAIDVDGNPPKRYSWTKNGLVSFPPCSPRFIHVRFTKMQIKL